MKRFRGPFDTRGSAALRPLRGLVGIAVLVGLLVGGTGTQIASGGSPDIDCADFDTQEQAQDFYDEHSDDFENDADPYNLDPDGDGEACEGLPDEDGADECPVDNVCVYSETNLVGDVVFMSGRGIDNTLFREMDNEAESVWNNRSGRTRLFETVNANGRSVCVDAGEVILDLSTPTAFQDVASSAKLQKKRRC